MPIGLQLALFFGVGLPIVWLLSEFQSRRWLRILLGVLSISACVPIAVAVGVCQQLNDNALYGEASSKLLDSAIAEIDAGRTDKLLPALRQLRDEFQPTYENRANYDELVNRFVSQIKTTGSPTR